MFRDMLGEGCFVIYCVKARDAAKYLQFMGQPSTSSPPAIKNYLVPNVISAESEKLWDLAERMT